MTRFGGKVPANSVPAAAVIRGGQALFGMIGRKEHVGGSSPPFGRNPWAPPRVSERGESLSKDEEGGIPGGEVKFVDTGRKAESEGSPLPLD